MAQNQWSEADLRARLVHYGELKPCTSAFIDTRTPGSETKENFTIIGPGVAENPEQHVHINIPHGFNIGGARQPAGCVNSQHSHETAEVFVVHSGRWAFTLGADCEDGHIELGPGDTISIPIHVFRGFTNIGDGPGFLFAVLGGDDPGHVTWAPSVFEKARDYGLVLLKNGRLIDTTAGEQAPEGAEIMPATTAADVAKLNRMTTEELARCVVRADDPTTPAVFPFGENIGITEAPIIGAACDADGVCAGQMSWPHGFQLRRQQLKAGAVSPRFERREEEVLMVQRGKLSLSSDAGEFELGPGDVMTVPIGMPRVYANPGSEDACVYVVRGGDLPSGFHPNAATH
ncbi:MAG: cupin domain-containing protein [Pseudomonadota bacterium]